MSEAPSFKVSRSYQVHVPGEEQTFLMPQPDYDYIRARIRKIKSSSSAFFNGASFFGGVSAGALTSICTYDGNSLERKYLLWSILVLAALIGLVLLLVGFRDDARADEVKEGVDDYMGTIEKRQKAAAASAAVAQDESGAATPSGKRLET